MLAIISDVHDNLANLDKVLKYCQNNQITTLACCGDLTNEDTLSYLANNFTNNIWLVSGNADLYEEADVEQYENINYLDREGGFFTFENKQLGLCHEPHLIDNLLQKNPNLNIIFYGHTHKPWEDQKGHTKLINPGNVANVRYQPTFATYNPETDELQLHFLNQMN